MNIKITARKFRIKESLREFIMNEVSSLDKLNEDIMDVDIILSFVNNNEAIKTAELIVKIPGRILKSEETSDEFRKSIGLTVLKMEKQLLKFKSKRIDSKRVEKVA